MAVNLEVRLPIRRTSNFALHSIRRLPTNQKEDLWAILWQHRVSNFHLAIKNT